MTSLLDRSFARYRFFALSGGFAYLTAPKLEPESDNRPVITSSVTPSLIQQVQEYQPVVHRLRLSASS